MFSSAILSMYHDLAALEIGDAVGRKTLDFDVTVVGAGTAGTYAAWRLAEAGWSVLLIDRRPPNTGGARWLNAVVPEHFDRAGLPRPTGAELHAAGGPVHMLSPSGRFSINIADRPTWEIDMRQLSARLWQGATDAGVTMMWEVHDVGFQFDSQTHRPLSMSARHHDENLSVTSRLFVDASGRAGVVRQASPTLSTACPPLSPHDVCSAHQWLYKVADKEGAESFLKEHGAKPGDVVLRLSETCGYGVRSISMSPTLDEVGVLTGTLTEGTTATAYEMLQQTLDENPWIGEELYGGSGLIPIRRPYAQLGSVGVALIGDAAGQLATVHGSGVGFGLIGAKMLTEATRGVTDPGSYDTIWKYQSSFLREFGGAIAANDAIRRMSISLGVDGVESLYAHGLMTAEAAKPALRQEFETPSLSELLKQGATLVKNPGLAIKTVPWLIRSALSPVIYNFYPQSPSARSLNIWRRVEETVLGS